MSQIGHHFRFQHGEEYSDLRKICAGVPQDSVLEDGIFSTCTPTTSHKVDDTALLVTDQDTHSTITKLQTAVNNINNWTKKWRIELNDAIHVNFTKKKNYYSPVIIN